MNQKNNNQKLSQKFKNPTKKEKIRKVWYERKQLFEINEIGIGYFKNIEGPNNIYEMNQDRLSWDQILIFLYKHYQQIRYLCGPFLL